jgi:ribosomal protein S18 acetylase RimI-like enzyme
MLAQGQIHVRQLTPDDAEIYRAIRLESLKLDGEAFGSSFEFESAQTTAWFADRLRQSAGFGAFQNGELAGTACLAVQQGLKTAHKGKLWGMYVRAETRASGVGRRLVEAVIAAARDQVELIQLSVVETNVPARRLYASLGFVDYGLELNALKFEERYVNEVLMAKALI